jgi:hypothetical protein
MVIDAADKNAKSVLKSNNWRRSAESRDAWRRGIEEDKV